MSDATHSAAAPAHGHGEHAVPLSLLIFVFLGLMALTGLTVLIADVDTKRAVAKFLNLAPNDVSRMSLIFAMVIATVKASMVCLYFMHLRWDKPFNSVVFVSSLVFVALFIGLAMLDVVTFRHEPHRQNIQPGDSSAVVKLRKEVQEKQAAAQNAPAPQGAGGH